ncbi:MAG: DUF3298 and DUF4163 domain-containing protein [Anaerolineae bacterium]
MSDRLSQLKAQYDSTPVPHGLSARVDALCEQYRPKTPAWRWVLATAAGVLVLFVAGVNALPVQAAALQDVPVLGTLVRVFTFREYRSDTGYGARIRIAQVVGLNNQELEEVVNAELRADGEAFIAQYEADVAELEAELGTDAVHMGVETYYEVLASNDEVFSLRVEYFWVAGGSAVSFDFYTVNQQTGEMITLDSLFRSGSGYLGAINAYLIEQMAAENAAAGHPLYWIDDKDPYVEAFMGIDADHNFYINAEGKLVIAFDEYEVASGAMGTPEFVIPTELIAGLLAEGAPIH